MKHVYATKCLSPISQSSYNTKVFVHSASAPVDTSLNAASKAVGQENFVEPAKKTAREDLAATSASRVLSPAPKKPQQISAVSAPLTRATLRSVLPARFDNMPMQTADQVRVRTNSQTSSDNSSLVSLSGRASSAGSEASSRRSSADSDNQYAPGSKKFEKLSDAVYKKYVVRVRERNWLRPTWSTLYRDELSLHYDNHRHDFENLQAPYRATSKQEYGNLAVNFMLSSRADSDTLFTFRQNDGCIVRYDRQRNIFGVLDRSAKYIRTFYRPILQRRASESNQLGPNMFGEDFVARSLIKSASERVSSGKNIWHKKAASLVA